ncbi:MAG: hypothetical protein BWY06_00854 [Candidatus Latescibacteria bacterium ADurb.Bin168]|nr:MAG: hypothetical protein BWY06_00854 [Candidatus Latescibacteria bacterium ADurb.Bin168]
MISCGTAQALTGELIRGTLEEKDAARLRGHLQTCRECRAEFDLESRLVRTGARAPVYHPPGDFAARVVERWQGETAKAMLDPAEIVRKVLADALKAAYAPLCAAYVPVIRETWTTLAGAREALREASGVVREVLKDLMWGRFVLKTT